MPQTLFEQAQRPRAVRAKLEDLATDFACLGGHAVRLGKEVGVNQADEVGKAVVVAMMGRGCEKQDVVGLRCELLGQLVAFRFLGLVAAPGGALGVGAAFVGFVNNDEVPPLLPDAFADFVLLGV